MASNPLNENQLSIATNQGVYTSNDGGDNWTKIYDALVHKIYHSSADDGTLVGIVLDSEISRFRVIYSQNMGETWEHVIDQEFLDTAVADVAIRFEEELVEFYIGSIDLGLMHYSLEIQDLGTNNFSNVSPVIQIYPNPVKDILYINAQKSIKNISVFSLNGQELLNNKINKTTTNFDISILANGVYLIRIETENDLKTLKFIKQ